MMGNLLLASWSPWYPKFTGLLLLIALMGHLLLAFPLAGRRAIVAQLLLLQLTEMLHKLLDLPALLGAVAPRVVHREPWTALITAKGLLWLLVMAVGAPASGLLLLAFFVFLFLFLLLLAAAASTTGLLAFPTSGVGWECQAHPSVALTHLSARLKSSETSCTSCVANFSSIFSSLTPYRKARTTEALEMWGMVFRTWENCWMKDHSDSLGRCYTTWRSTSLPR
jgi:hypothetical protein